MTRRAALIVVVVGLGLGLAPPAFAQSSESAGYIGKTIPRLEIDDCRPNDPSLTAKQLGDLAGEHFTRGTTLYSQGDYEGAVQEFVSAYCASPFYRVLKDIGQAYERSLDYEKSIGYLERYVRTMPDDAKKMQSCDPDPQDDKANIDRRIRLLYLLPSKVFVETTPGGAQITIGNDSGVFGRAKSGEQINIAGGDYDMTIELAGYETVTRKVDVRIGKPYTYYAKLEPLRGSLSVRVSPADARVFVGDRFVGIGHYEDTLPSGTYTISAEAPDRTRVERKVEVLPKQLRRELVELPSVPQTGRRQLIVGATIGVGYATGALLFAFNQTAIASAGSVIGGSAALVGSYFQLPHDLSLGTSDLTMTIGVTGGVLGGMSASAFTTKPERLYPAIGAGLLLGGAVGYWAGERYEVSPGDAAVFNSAVLWGTAAGALFDISFSPPRGVGSALVLSGLGMGSIGGVLLARSYEISRTHAVLIDVGGVIGAIGGLALASVTNPVKETGPDMTVELDKERLGNYALGGMAIGLIAAGVLTRNLDEPKLNLKPALGVVPTVDGKTATTYGLSTDW